MKHKLTEQGLENFKNELDNLKNIERPRIIQAIADARAQGDLSENADYDVARNEQSRVEARIVELEEIVKNAVII
ncbi:MAG TPA: transcription elongation factor GreA, partial [Bacilli bacterium]|nr:transcription elongation factor GreA [Bacilli bacterium]